MNKKKKGFLKEILFVIVLASVCSAVILFTKASVGSRSELSFSTVKVFLKLLAGRVPEDEKEAFRVFNQRFEQKTTGRIKLWQNQQELSQWAFESTGAGMWGEITIGGLVDTETTTIIGLRVLNQNETAGIGARISENIFCEQFSNLKFLPKVEMSKARYKNNQFDAVSGATASSKAIETILNKTIRKLKLIQPNQG
jgi:Na+-translocating ferredoxin:NAD+ oxidoreductase RnfG subunit